VKILDADHYGLEKVKRIVEYWPCSSASTA
jgi:ATP-dependent Lon protease